MFSDDKCVSINLKVHQVLLYVPKTEDENEKDDYNIYSAIHPTKTIAVTGQVAVPKKMERKVGYPYFTEASEYHVEPNPSYKNNFKTSRKISINKCIYNY